MYLWSTIVGVYKRKKNIIQRFQNKVLSIVNAPWYMLTSDLHHYLGLNTVKREFESIAPKRNTKLRDRVNTETSSLANPFGFERRLQRRKPFDLIRSSLLDMSSL